MIRDLFLSFFFLSSSSLFAMLVGNPAQPDLLECSILRTKPTWWSFRAGYVDDWVYKQRFRDEFKINGVPHTKTLMKLSTYSGLLTLNFKNRIDLYGLVGSSRMQIDEEIFTKRALSWGIGGKLILLNFGDFFIGTDVKYFKTSQKPRYFVIDGLPYNIVSSYRLKYDEIQAALGMAYRAWIFSPYINATYLLTHIEPEPYRLYVRLPDVNEIVDVPTYSIVGQRKWGMALGLTLVDCQKASLSFEWRAFNQNTLDVNGEIRF